MVQLEREIKVSRCDAVVNVLSLSCKIEVLLLLLPWN